MPGVDGTTAVNATNIPVKNAADGDTFSNGNLVMNDCAIQLCNTNLVLPIYREWYTNKTDAPIGHRVLNEDVPLIYPLIALYDPSGYTWYDGGSVNCSVTASQYWSTYTRQRGCSIYIVPSATTDDNYVAKGELYITIGGP